MSDPFAYAPIYSLGAREPAEARTVALGWPVWALHARVGVVGPSSHDRLDLFEAGILDLSAAGVRGRRDLAADLDLDPELVVHVVAGLQARELLDRSLAPTALAEELLELRVGQRERHVSGFVLIDAWGGRVLPGLHGALEPLEATDPRPAGGWKSVKVTLGRRPRHLSLLPAPRSEPPDVEAGDQQAAVREALSRGRLAVSAPAAIRGIAALGDPWPARVLVWAYRRQAGSGDDVWPLDREVRVLEPTGGEDAIDFEEALRELGAQPAGERALESLHQDDHRSALGEGAREQQRRSLLARLGSVPGDHPAVSSLADALLLRADGWRSQALVELGSALETTLRAAASAQAYRGAQERLDRSGRAAAVLREALEACGFRPEVPQPTVNALGSRDRRLVLRPLAALIVLLAADDEGHPLRALALDEAEDAARREGRPMPIAWLNEVDDLAHYRNSAAHGVSDDKPRPSLDPQTSDRWFQLVERALHHLLRST
jgi:hypothetical protein